MTPERWREVKGLFEDLCALPVRDRLAELERRAGDDAQLFREVQRLLNCEEGPEDFLAPPELSKLPRTVREVRGDLEGLALGGWTLVRELGRGGMGVVWLARDGDGRESAVKLLPPHLLRTGESVERFRREALVAARLDHENLVRVHALGEDGGTHYLVMDYVDGPSLRDVLAARYAGAPPPLPLDPSDPRVAAELCRQIAHALAAVHAEGLVHRDVKPSNILLSADAKPHLSDFGIAHDADLSALTSTGALIGTPHYMSPEQARALQDPVDHRSDLYSLGAVLFELLTGRLPHEGDSGQEVLYSIAHTPAPPVRRFTPDVPRDLAQICERALRRRPGERYPNALALARDLESFLAGKPVVAARLPMRVRLRDRLESRAGRFLAAAAGVIVAAGLGAWAAKSAFASTRTASVVVELSADVEVRVRSDTESGFPGRVTTREVVAEGRGPLAFHAPPGALSLLIDAQDLGSAEIRRTVAAGDELRLVANLRRPSEVSAGMVLVPGGPHRLTLTRHDSVTHTPLTLEQTIELEPFWIDRALVTTGAWREYCDATGAPRPLSWTKALGPRGELPRPDFWDLPVTGITLPEARAFAEWSGKRLPSYPEWYVATGGEDRAWLEPLLAEGLERHFVLGHANHVLDDAGAESTTLAWVRFAAPARREAPGQGPFGLLDALGNICEFLDSPWFEPRDGVWGFPDPAQRTLATGCWHTAPGTAAADPWALLTAQTPTGFSADTGFRCVKSAGNP